MAAIARASEPDLRLVGDTTNQSSACPTAEQVATALGRALPGRRVVVIAPDAAPLDGRTFGIIDQGDRFRVEGARAVKEFPEAARRCAERARAAAVHIALSLEATPEPVSAPPPAPTPPVVSPPPAPRRYSAAPLPPPHFHVALELGPRLEGRLPTSATVFQVDAGVTVRLVGEARWIGFSLGVAPLGPLIGAPTGRSLSRYPIEAGVRLPWRRDRLTVVFDGGAFLEPELDAPEGGLNTGASRSHMNLGVRGLLGLRIALMRRLEWYFDFAGRASLLRVGDNDGSGAAPGGVLSLGGGLSLELR